MSAARDAAWRREALAAVRDAVEGWTRCACGWRYRERCPNPLHGVTEVGSKPAVAPRKRDKVPPALLAPKPRKRQYRAGLFHCWICGGTFHSQGSGGHLWMHRRRGEYTPRPQRGAAGPAHPSGLP